MAVFPYEGKPGQTLQGAQCAQGHAWQDRTLAMIAFRQTGVVGTT
jgi:hypothetical protein